jgi:hypothetical protein
VGTKLLQARDFHQGDFVIEFVHLIVRVSNTIFFGKLKFGRHVLRRRSMNVLQVLAHFGMGMKTTEAYHAEVQVSSCLLVSGGLGS